MQPTPDISCSRLLKTTPAPPAAVDLPDPVPLYISRFQARAVLMMEGLLDAALAALESAHPLSRLAWEHEPYYRRDSPTVISIALQLGLSAAQVDELFRKGLKIKA